MHVYLLYAWCPLEVRDGIESPGTGINGCEPLCGCWDSRSFGYAASDFNCKAVSPATDIISFLLDVLILCVNVLPACMHVCTLCVFQVPVEVRRGHWILWHWSYMWLGATLWVLVTSGLVSPSSFLRPVKSFSEPVWSTMTQFNSFCRSIS